MVDGDLYGNGGDYGIFDFFDVYDGGIVIS